MQEAATPIDGLPIAPLEGQLSVEDRVTEALRDLIVRGRLAEGTPLVQRDLARLLAVSQTPVRTGLGRLEREGFVVVGPNGRSTVSRLTREDFEEIYAARLGLEGLAARRGAEAVSPQDVGRMRDLLADLRALAARQEVDDYLRLRWEFHATCYRASGRRRLVEEVERLFRRSERYNRIVLSTAERFNDPGHFTAMIGFEWTSGPNGVNLHRNVLFRGGKDTADKIVPISTYDTEDPERLWDWMEKSEKEAGVRLLAIPHNGNLSNGLMFDDVTFTKGPMDRAYAQRRMRWEPVYEVTQMKGDGETHPKLSPKDKFADFYTWDKGSFGSDPKTTDMLPREYAREALKRGLAYQKKLGTNPFKFGMIGSTDSHTGLSTAEEDNYFGKIVALEPTADPIRFYEPLVGRFSKNDSDKTFAWQTAAAGIAAVWARENTREALWDALARKEVYATTGTRMLVRVFAGWGFKKGDLDRSDFAKYGYDKGVPMGGDLPRGPAAAAKPGLLIRVLRDPEGANLDRVQVVKGWLEADGSTREKVYDVAWSGNRKPGKDGSVPPVGSTVNVADASYTNAIGAPFLQTFWTDKDFDPSKSAFYYVRVLEIPTPRWTTFDAKVFGVKIPQGAPVDVQERAYTSPIWYTPG